MVEQEVKLQFEDVEAARSAVITAGGRLVASRRLLEDRLFDTASATLQKTGRTLRVRRDHERAFLTVKGPLQRGPVKARDEFETTIGDASIVEAILDALGFRPVFRSQKYREEYELGDAKLAIDDAPVGVFIEIEATPAEISRIAGLVGRTAADYRLESYPTLWRRWCDERGLGVRDMVFEDAH